MLCCAYDFFSFHSANQHVLVLLQLEILSVAGGILDRLDSYIFTGALVYSFVKVGIPLFGG